MRRPTPDGLTTNDEAKELYAIEDRIRADLERGSESLLVLVITGEGRRIFFLQTRAPAAAKERVAALQASTPSHRLELKITPDKVRPVRNGIFVGVCSLLGSLTLYCGESMMNRDNPGGPTSPIGDVHADPPKFVKLAEGKLTEEQSSPTIDVSGYAEVVLYTTGITGVQDRCNFPYIRTKFRMDPSTPFSISATAGSFPMKEGGRIRTEGTEMQLYLQGPSQLPCSGTSFSYVLAGIK